LQAKITRFNAGRVQPARTYKSPAYRVVQFMVLTLGSILILYPLAWMISCSLKTPQAISGDMYSILVPFSQIDFVGNYSYAWVKAGFGTTFMNSVKITFSSLFFMVILAYLTSYTLSRMEFFGRNFLMTVFVTLMLVPLGQVVMIPQYRLIRQMGLSDNIWACVILYINGGIPFSVFLLTSFISRIPITLDEAAHIDGAGRLRIIYQICLPLSLPGLATVIIFQFMQIWNDYFTPLIYLISPQNRTITLGLTNFFKAYSKVDYNYLFAALCIVSVPVIVMYLLFQNLYISGITAGAVKE
jgi:ABC-type glycerol-3-phosphate transport system permease component